MERVYCIGFRRSAGNLHIELSGEFSGHCAWELLKTIRWQTVGTGRIFVNTAQLRTIHPAAVAWFKAHIGERNLPKDWLYFKGKKGFKIAPDGSRVIIRSANPGTVKKKHLRPVRPLRRL